MSKRKTGALRNKEDTRYTHTRSEKTFYMNETKTINFNQATQQRHKPKRSIELLPKTINQEKYILALLNEETDIVVVSGPAGTGKTYLEMLAAIKALRSGECQKLVLTRPAITVDDEKHGFLPGDLTAKMEPWTKPLLDVLQEHYSVKEVMYMIEEQILEIAPLAFMRGRTFKNSYIILDEAQNASPNQLKMIMTRIGENSKIIIGGDIEQTDRRTSQNGLLDLTEKLNKNPISGIASCTFDMRDVQRHKLIGPILGLYD